MRFLLGIISILGFAWASGGCFVEASGGAYGLSYDEVSTKTATGVGIAFGAYWDTGPSRIAAGIGGDVFEADGYQDSSGTGSVAHGVGPYYLRGDTSLKALNSFLSLDATLVLLGGPGPSVVIYDEVMPCTSRCSESVEIKSDVTRVKHAGPSLGAFLGPSIALHNKGPGELRLSVGVNVMHTRIDSRGPMTAFGPQVRIVYGFTQFGSKDAGFAGLFDGYSNTLDDDLRDYNRDQGDRNKGRSDEKNRQDKENERKKRGY